jgi:hypothetical protein
MQIQSKSYIFNEFLAFKLNISFKSKAEKITIFSKNVYFL